MVYLIIKGTSISWELSRRELLHISLISFISLFSLLMLGSYLIDLSQRPPPPDPTYAPYPAPSVPVPTDTPQNAIIGNYNLYAYIGKAPLIDGIMSDNET